MMRTSTFVIQALLCLAALVVQPVAGQCQGSGGLPIRIEVMLPADAKLEVGGYVTRSLGSRRLFESPPVAEGYRYYYEVRARWQGKEAVQQVTGQPGSLVTIQFAAADFKATTSTVQDNGIKTLPSRDGFVTMQTEGRWWIFREGSKDLSNFKKTGEPEKSVTRVNAAPYKTTLRAPDIATLEEYLTAKPGFVTKFDDGRLWVFRKGSPELASFLKDGELAKHVVRPGAGPRSMTLKGPDRETLDAYMSAK